MRSNVIERKSGRPRAIPEEWESFVISLYWKGFGYRSIKRELSKEGISVSWSTVRRLIKERLDENLNYRLKYCCGGIVAKPKDDHLPELVYCFKATR